MELEGLRRGTSCTGPPELSALHCLDTKDLTQFTDLVNTGEPLPLPSSHWLNTALEGRAGRTLLLESIARGLDSFTDTLLRAGAGADLYSEELGGAPLHAAARAGDQASVRLLLNERGGRSSNVADINRADKDGRTALHIAAERADLGLLRLLLARPGIRLDPADRKGGQTPLYLSGRAGDQAGAELLLQAGASLDRVCLGRPVRVVLEERLPGLKVDRAPMVTRQESEAALDRLVEMAEGGPGNATEFRGYALQLDTDLLSSHQAGGLTLLQKCAAGGRAGLAQILLTEGADPDCCPEGSTAPPVHLAAYRGHAAVLQALRDHRADFRKVRSDTGETVLHRVLSRDDAFDTEKLTDCLEFLLCADSEPWFTEQMDQIINTQDLLGNTALHLATQRWPQQVVRRLLERGANIGLKNKWGETPISKIRPETMEEFLDEFCLQSRGDPNHPDFNLTFRYSFLAPPVEALPAEVRGPYADLEEGEKEGEAGRFALPESESLWYLGQSRDHRHLLRHPVITSFLWCKWTRIRRYVNRNLRLYLFFVIILTWFVFERFGGRSLKTYSEVEPNGSIRGLWVAFFVFSLAMLGFVLRDWVTDVQDAVRTEQILTDSGGSRLDTPPTSWLGLVLSNWVEAGFLAALVAVLLVGAPALPATLATLLAILAAREMFQLAVSLRRYFLTAENWLEMAMLGLVAAMLILPDPGNRDLKRHLAGLSLFLSWAELITFVAKHPRLTRYNVYISMFYKVFTSFAYFLLWYIFFIIAFGLGFYIMLHDDDGIPASGTNTTGTVAEDSGLQQFFDNPFLTFVKTCTMFVGELEFSDIPINLDSPLMPVSYSFFLLFVFLIVVVLMNLLNGLAVSDTSKIQEKAEVVAQLSTVETVSYAESLLLGDPFDFLSNVPALRWVAGRVPSLSCCRALYRLPAARQLFQRLSGARGVLLFYNFLPERQLVVRPNVDQQSCVRVEQLGSEIIRAAKEIVLRKERQTGTNEERDKMSEMEKKLDHSSVANQTLTRKIAELEGKIDLLLQKL